MKKNKNFIAIITVILVLGIILFYPFFEIKRGTSKYACLSKSSTQFFSAGVCSIVKGSIFDILKELVDGNKIENLLN